MTFHLLYSKSGMQLEARLDELIRGLSTGDLGDLSPCQLQQVNELHKNTIKKEKDSTEKYAKLQETVADTSMVELSHAATELMREEAGGCCRGGQPIRGNSGFEEGRISRSYAKGLMI
ncbi:protein DOG1-like 3 [Forsythia ovata]|uniref:Protein DOG1-like 3 n=1 Tax=Forsythia ovata TaxID=205694 RepID=A0ABD1U8E8_9LAMI